MEVITWKSPGIQQKEFNFSVGSKPFGTLTFLTKLSSNATFVTKTREIKFEHKSFWNKLVSVSNDGQPVGKMSYTNLFTTRLTLVDGKVFRLRVSYLNRNFKWLDAGETPVVECGGRAWKGSVSRLGTLTDQESEVLVSAAMVGFMFNSFRMNFLIFGAVAIAVLAIVVFASK
jgi:hypothetical protein